MLLKTTYNVLAPVLICTISMATLNILYHCVMVIQNHCFDHILFKHVHYPHALGLDLQKLHVYLIYFSHVYRHEASFLKGVGADEAKKKKNHRKKELPRILKIRGEGGSVV